jgi:RNA polymerase sigma factor (sigma-70 family)
MDVNNKRFWELLKPEHARAQHFCRGLIGNSEDGDDLYQESVLVALRKFSQLKSPDSFRSWFYRIVINRFHNRCRSWWIRWVIGIDERDAVGATPDPWQDHLRRDLITRLLRLLSPRDRALLILFEVEGWSTKELGELFKSSSGAVKVKLSRIRKALRKILAKMETEDASARDVKISKERVCVAGKSDPS